MADRYDEPLTPAGRFFLHPRMQQIINCSFGLKNPVDVDAVKAEIQNTLIKKHPRFSSLLVKAGDGREHWKKVDKVDIDQHVRVVPKEEEEEEEMGGPDFVNEYVAGLAISAPLDLSKPLWEVHLLLSNRCCVLRVHHALGDGVSLMSLFLACCERADDPSLPVSIPGANNVAKKTKKSTASWALLARALELLMVAWYTFVYVVDFLLHIFWVKDKATPLSGAEGVELWPRKLRTVTFKLADLKLVKNSTGATINDVLIGVITLALEKYLQLTSPTYSRRPVRVTGLAMVNTRSMPGLQELVNMMKKNTGTRWGNNFGFMVLPVCLWKAGINDDPLGYVRRAKKTTEKKKLSLEALFSYKSGALIMYLLGPEIATLLNYKIIANTTFTMSNLMGPSDEVMFAGNPITYIRTTSSGLPHALTMHMISYMDKIDLQMLVAKDIIQQPEVLGMCFEDALSDMRASVLDAQQKKKKML